MRASLERAAEAYCKMVDLMRERVRSRAERDRVPYEQIVAEEATALWEQLERLTLSHREPRRQIIAAALLRVGILF